MLHRLKLLLILTDSNSHGSSNSSEYQGRAKLLIIGSIKLSIK